MADLKKGRSQKHHIVPKSYLNQWRDFDNQLEIFTHSDKNFQRRGSDWVGFKRANYNIFENDELYYLPEQITAKVDARAIEVIRSLAPDKELTSEDRSALATFVALQYIRTPRFRDESNLMLDEQLKESFFDYQRKLTDEELLEFKKEALEQVAKNKDEQDVIDKIKSMPDDEFLKTHRDFLAKGEVRIGLNTFGHSKLIFKVPQNAERLFSFLWLFFKAPKGTSFATSDNPCFVAPKKEADFGVGLFSKNGLVIFPLRPDICLIITPEVQSPDMRYRSISKSAVKELNRLILKHSYEAVVARNRTHLQSLLKDYVHTKTRAVKTKDVGEYKMTWLS